MDGLRALLTSRAGLFAAGLTIGSGSFLIGLEHPLRTLEAPKGMISFQLAGAADAAARIVDDWQREGVVGRARASLVLDYPFLLGYASLLALLALWLAFRDWNRLGRLAPLAIGLAAASALLVVAAGLCDALENVQLLRELAGPPTDIVAGRALRLARLKFGLLGAGGAGIAILGSVHAWHVQRQFPLLQYLYFCRFPLLTAAVLLALPAFCVLGMPVLLRNLFAVEGTGLAVVSALAFLLAWTTLLTLGNILLYAEPRLRVAAVPKRLLEWLYNWRAFVAGFLSAPIVIVAVSYDPAAWVPQLLAAAAGLAGAVLVLIVAELLQQRYAGPIAPEERVFDSGLGRWLQRRAMSGDLARSLPKRPSWVVRLVSWLSPAGYVADGRLLPGHVHAAWFFAVSAALYLALYVPLRPDVDRASLPALAYVLILLTVVGWLLPGMSFFLDRFRTPVLLALIAALFLANELVDSDRFYRMFPPSAEEDAAPSPLAALERNDAQLGARRPIVVVAASGGGIRAALWTVQVLTALQAPEAVGPDFPRAIRLISSVSGGSVGTLFYLDSYQAGAPDAARALDHAGVNALDAAAWGIAYPELWRTFLLGTRITGRFLDRGWALEEVWRRLLSTPEARLSDWRRRVAEGTLPPAVLNATLAETGEQLLFTPLEVPREWNAHSLRLSDGLYDIGLSTAARLSASFPWVSPMATGALKLEGRELAASERPGPHVADGGYYDNFGVVTAVHWIETVLGGRDPELMKRGILLVVISASPLGREELAALPAGRRGGSFYDTVGPLALLARVRDATQLARNRVELDLLKDKWRALGARLSYVIFEPAGPGPLSWKLTTRERERVLGAWSLPPNPDRLAELKRCFADMASCQGEPEPPAAPAPELLGDIPARQAR